MCVCVCVCVKKYMYIWKHWSTSLLLLDLCFGITWFSKNSYIDGKLLSTLWELSNETDATEVNKEEENRAPYQEASMV